MYWYVAYAWQKLGGDILRWFSFFFFWEKSKTLLGVEMSSVILLHTELYDHIFFQYAKYTIWALCTNTCLLSRCAKKGSLYSLLYIQQPNKIDFPHLWLLGVQTYSLTSINHKLFIKQKEDVPDEKINIFAESRWSQGEGDNYSFIIRGKPIKLPYYGTLPPTPTFKPSTVSAIVAIQNQKPAKTCYIHATFQIHLSIIFFFLLYSSGATTQHQRG